MIFRIFTKSQGIYFMCFVSCLQIPEETHAVSRIILNRILF